MVSFFAFIIIYILKYLMNKLLYILILNIIVGNAYVEESDTYEESMEEAQIVYMDTKDLASYYFLDGFVERAK